MIGSLSAVEELFGFLWEEDSQNQDYYYDIFQKVRSSILDRGNDQIRRLEDFFSPTKDDNKGVVHFTTKKED